jgi:hypothetical protein
MLKNETRAASVTANGPVTCLYMNRDAFTQLLGPMSDIFASRVENYNKMSGLPSPSSKKSIQIVTPQKINNYLDTTLRLEDLKIMSTLGKGSFGHVKLCKHINTGQVYALKIVKKQQVVQLGQQEHMMSKQQNKKII